MASPRAVLRWAGRNGKRVAITITGFVLILAGLALIWLPGPLTIPLVIAGLAVLATEYAWAQRTLDLAKTKAKEAAARVRRRKSPAD